MMILVVGDKAKVYEPLLKLGYEVIELDTDGNPMYLAPITPVKVEEKKETAPATDPKQKAKVYKGSTSR